MPESAPRTKIDAVRAWGGEPVLVPTAEVFRFLKEHGWEQEPYAFIHPWTNRDVMTGHGSLGLEIAEDLPDVDTVLVPVGGGGLLAGVGSALRAVKPDVRILAVEPEGCPGLSREPPPRASRSGRLPHDRGRRRRTLHDRGDVSSAARAQPGLRPRLRGRDQGRAPQSRSVRQARRRALWSARRRRRPSPSPRPSAARPPASSPGEASTRQSSPPFSPCEPFALLRRLKQERSFSHGQTSRLGSHLQRDRAPRVDGLRQGQRRLRAHRPLRARRQLPDRERQREHRYRDLERGHRPHSRRRRRPAPRKPWTGSRSSWRASGSDVSVKTVHRRRHDGGQVSYRVFLPAEARVAVETVNGAVSVTGIHGSVQAESVNGGLKLESIDGEVSAETTNGSIQTSYRRAGDGRHHFETTNGSVQNLICPRTLEATSRPRLPTAAST